ncbi:hypothetical protein K474DRAFT_381765 [Panus rudis PR-1116 ss-1]|nr:hypothetical protein K474DRAFT_381765 [Panus rudis PR-1116 ss-1]
MSFNNASSYIPDKLRLFWERVTFTKITIVYFVFSVLHCVIQIIFQVQAFNTNANAEVFLNNIIAQGNATQPGFAVLGNDLRWCETVPNTVDASSCKVIWQGDSVNPTATKGKDTINATDAAGALDLDGVKSTSGSASATSSAASSSASSTVISSVAVSSTALVSAQSSAPTSAASSSVPLSAGAASASVASSSAPSASSSTSRAAISSTSAASSSSASVTQGATNNAASSAATTSSTSVVSVTSASAVPATSTFTVVVKPTATPNGEKKEDDDDDDDDDDDEEEDDDDDDDDDEEEEEEEHDHRKRMDVESIPRIVSAIQIDGQKEVKIDGLDGLNGTDEVTLDQMCLVALNWPASIVENTKREDIVFICFQVWVLGMSLVALLNESIPHIFASLLTHVLATAWGGFQIVHTKQFRANFIRLSNGACGINLLPHYWADRAKAEIPSLVLNVVALFISAFLTWRLIKLFGWQTFKRVGASLTIRRLYNVILILSIIIQLSAFFIVVSAALWLDQIYNGNIGRLTTAPQLFRGVVILVILLVIPWLSIGWISVRREHRIAMLIFLVLSFGYLVGWSSMFVSKVFRWTFAQWRFFSIMACASVIITASTLALGVYCRVNFGKGLTRYLNSERRLEDDFVPVDSRTYFNDREKEGSMYEEKVAFPSNDPLVPTYSATFGPNPAVDMTVPPPAHTTYAPRIMGPRFFQQGQQSENPFEQPSYQVQVPPSLIPAYPGPTRSLTTDSDSLTRHGSGASQHSLSSITSSGTAQSASSKGSGSGGSHEKLRKQRWIIE